MLRARADTRADTRAHACEAELQPPLDGWTDCKILLSDNALRRPAPVGRGWTRLDGGGVRTGIKPGRDPSAWHPAQTLCMSGFHFRMNPPVAGVAKRRQLEQELVTHVGIAQVVHLRWRAFCAAFAGAPGALHHLRAF